MADTSSDDDVSDDDFDVLESLAWLYGGQKFRQQIRVNPFDELTEIKFRSRYRIKKSTPLRLLSQIEDKLEYTTNKNDSVSPINQLLLALRFYATGTFQIVVGDCFGVYKSTVCRCVHRVTRAICSLSDQYIKFPATEEEKKLTSLEFFSKSNFPGCLGAIDCTHVPIQSPGGQNAEIFRNRKGYFSINVQLVCNPSLFITNVVARWPGSVHDSTIFDFSHLRAKFELGEIGDGHLIGDSGYPCRKYLLTPVLHPSTPAESAYNKSHISARNCIERVNGVIKKRFPALKYGLRLKLNNTLPVIVAIAVVHNIAIGLNEDEPPIDIQLQEYIEARRRRGISITGIFENENPVPTSINDPGATAQRAAIIEGHFR